MRWMLAMLGMCAAAQTTVPHLFVGYQDSAYAYYTLNAAAVRAANGFYATAATSVTAVWLQFGAVTTGDTLRVGIYGVDANGFPTGTALGYVDYVVTTGDANQWRQFGFSPAIAISANTGYAVVMEFPSYNGGNFQIRRGDQILVSVIQGWTAFYYNGTSWAVNASTTAMIIEATGGRIKPRYYMSESRSTVSININSSPDERAVACTFDRAFVLRGISRYGGTYGGTGPAVLRVYRGGSTVLEVQARLSPDSNGFVVTPTTRLILEPNVEYILAFRPTSTSNATFLQYPLNYPTAYQQLSAWLPEWASGMCRSLARTDDGTWSELPGTLHGIAFVVEDVR